jgi:hypothetical protein
VTCNISHLKTRAMRYGTLAFCCAPSGGALRCRRTGHGPILRCSSFGQ